MDSQGIIGSLSTGCDFGVLVTLRDSPLRPFSLTLMFPWPSQSFLLALCLATIQATGGSSLALGRVARKSTVRTNGNILGFDILTVWGARAWECESQKDFSFL